MPCVEHEECQIKDKSMIQIPADLAGPICGDIMESGRDSVCGPFIKSVNQRIDSLFSASRVRS